MKKSIVIIMLIIMISFVIPSYICNTQATVGNPDSFISNTGYSNQGAIGVANIIVGVIRRIGELVAVIMLSVIGIKYIMGSVEEKAEYKQTMWPYIIGAILIIAGAEITNIIFVVMKG